MNYQNQNIEAVTLLELFLSCRSLDDLDTVSVSDPFLILYAKNETKWVTIGRTELVWNNLNPNFANSIKIEYHFEEQQYLKFEVHHYISETQSRIIGITQTTLGQIAGSKNQIFMSDLANEKGRKSGKIIIKADSVKTCNDDISFRIYGSQIVDNKFWFWEGTNPFLRIYRLRKDDITPILVYQTEHIIKSKSPFWKPIQCKAQKLCNGDYQMPLKVELWDYYENGKHVYLGENSFQIEQLIEADKNNQTEVNREMKNKQKNNNTVGHITITDFKLKRRASFWDYISGGLQLNLMLAIDYTASNKNANDPKSLHYIKQDGAPSQYLQAIISVGEILINYDYDKKVPVYGFGCKPLLTNINTNQTLHCFPLNDDPGDPEVYGLDGIVQTYRSTVYKLSFDGPTYLHPVISEAMTMAKQFKERGSDNYLILMVLTDGETHDMQQSIDDVIASAHLPLSIIIIGIGNADFTNMEQLDNDDLSMMDNDGNRAQRDLVQFVPFNNFKGDASLLAKEVLSEMPDQVVEYMDLIQKKPNLIENVTNSLYYNQYLANGQNQQQQQISQQ